MIEKTHAELQKYHYQEVQTNPQYRLAGMMDVEREEMEMNVPPLPDLSEIEDRIVNLEEMSSERGSIPRRYYDEFQQIKGELAYLRNKLAEMPHKRREPAKSAYKGLDIER